MRSTKDLTTAALLSSQDLTGKTACRRDHAAGTFVQVQPARFDRPAGGTAEFLGRDGFRVAVAVPEGAVARPPIRVWCRRSPAVTAMTEAQRRRPQPGRFATLP